MNTKEAIKKALKSPNLTSGAKCLYVTPAGKHCIVGEVLSQAGASNELLKGWNDRTNGRPLSQREDLEAFAQENGFDLILLEDAQTAFDEPALIGHRGKKLKAQRKEGLQRLLSEY